MLSKTWYSVNKTTLWYFFFKFFFSHLSYLCTAWVQSIVSYQKYTTQVFRKTKIMKFVDLVSAENCVFINKYFSSNFNSVFCLAAGTHNHQIRFALKNLLNLPSCNASKFGTKAFSYFITASWKSHQTLS